MENLKEKIAKEVKKLGGIKHTDSDYKMTKHTSEDVINYVTEVAQKEIDEFALKFMDYLDFHDTFKNQEGKYVHGKNNGTFTPQEVLDGFKSFLEVSKNN